MTFDFVSMNSKKKMATGASKDLISSLPDDLICHILSFLSTKDAALTSVLSTRWRFLLAFVPILDFDTSNSIPMGFRLTNPKRFKDFVDRVMALQKNAPLNKFSLKCNIGPIFDDDHVWVWIENVLERGVVELHLDFSLDRFYYLSPNVLMSKTLVRLNLTGSGHFCITMREVFLPKLKILHLNDVVFKSDFAKLISGCHALEELVMFNVSISPKYFSVSNPNLKRVTFNCHREPRIRATVSFQTSNLIYLEFVTTIASEYPKGNFDSLVEASLGLRWPHNTANAGFNYSVIMTGNVTNLLMGISNVKILYLSSDTLEVLAFCSKAIPVFNNLLHLTIETCQEVIWEALPNLLMNCPNLESLVFKGLHYRDTNQCRNMAYRFKDTIKCDEDRCVCKPWEGTPIWLSSSSVKKLKVLKFGEITDDMDKQVDMIEYLVETMPKLEEVILYYDTPNEDDLKRVSAGFQKLEKVASTKCKIQVISDIIKFSSTVYLSSS